MKTVAILGASSDPAKFGNKSVRAHLKQGWKVFPINPKGGEIEGLPALSSLTDIPADQLTDGRLDRISVYLPPAVGERMLPEIQAAGAREVFFNPGSESPSLIDAAQEIGLDPIQACSIIAIGERSD